MQHLKTYLLAALLINPLLFFAQLTQENKKDDLIPWSTDNKLVWSYYKGKPDPASDAAATTTTYLGIQYNFSDGKITYKIECSFSKNKSWVSVKTDYILSHEQGHFDITEIFARKLNKLTKEYKFNKNSYQQDLQNIYNTVMNEKEKLQDQYDNETDYSRKKDKQAEWLKKIEKMLEEYNEFSAY